MARIPVIKRDMIEVLKSWADGWGYGITKADLKSCKKEDLYRAYLAVTIHRVRPRLFRKILEKKRRADGRY